MDSDKIAAISIPQVKRDLYRAIVDCSARGLMHSVKWLSELNHCLIDPTAAASYVPDPATTNPMTPLTYAERNPTLTGIAARELDTYQMAKSYFDCREYKRAAYYTEPCTSPVPHFLFLYATYMAKEKQRLDSMVDMAKFHRAGTSNADVQELVTQMRSLHAQGKLDGYGLYLYGLVLKRAQLNDEATSALQEALHIVPTLWSAWEELAPLVADRAALDGMRILIERHWMGSIFYAYCLLCLLCNEDALRVFEDLQEAGFEKSAFITAQMATAYHNLRIRNKAIELFNNIHEQDPFGLENVVTMSNIMFVQDMKQELTKLAQRSVEINRYRPETLCVVGNFYSMRREHHKAIVQFQRALKIDPQYLSAWTLMGHEFMDLKNDNAAIQCYRRTTEISRLDHRAWFGLGQAYEMKKLYSCSIYYYKIAQQLRPTDGHMLVALGEAYTLAEKYKNALVCFQKAFKAGDDMHGLLPLRVGDLHLKLGNLEAAVPAYRVYYNDKRALSDMETVCRVMMTLGHYEESIGRYDKATFYANRCVTFGRSVPEAHALLKLIASHRGQQSEPLALVAWTNRPSSPNDDDIIVVDDDDDDDDDLELAAISDPVTADEFRNANEAIADLSSDGSDDMLLSD